MRQIHVQSVHGRDGLRVEAEEPRMRGMASHRYVISGFDTADNRAARSGGFIPRFQDVSLTLETDGAANDRRPDGISLDALLAIAQDHLEGKQHGPNASMAKSMALDYVISARQLLAEDAAQQHNEQQQMESRWSNPGRLSLVSSL